MEPDFLNETPMKFGLKKNIIDEINNIFSEFPEVETAIIYGSRAIAKCRPGSDIDLTFKGKNLNLKIINKISLKLDDLFLPYTFDLSVFDQIENEDLIEHINRSGIVFYKQRIMSEINKPS
jgi:predicted nucleotidyltransferase